MKRVRIPRTSAKIISTSGVNMTFYLPKSQNVTVRRKNIYDLFKAQLHEKAYCGIQAKKVHKGGYCNRQPILQNCGSRLPSDFLCFNDIFKHTLSVKTMEKNDVASFFYYMWNCWCEQECETAFARSGCGWRHLWNKWCQYS